MAHNNTTKKTDSKKFLKTAGVVILILLLVGTLVAMFCTYYFYASVQTRLEREADTTSKYLNRYFSSSYSEFYEYSRNLVQNFSLADKMEMQILNESGKVMFSSSTKSALVSIQGASPSMVPLPWKGPYSSQSP